MCRRILLVLAGILSVCGTVRAGSVTVTVLPTTIQQGQAGIVSVLISGNDLGGTLLQSTNFEFRITPLLASGRLEFANPINPDPTFSRPNYVFGPGASGDSFDFLFGGGSLGARSTVGVPNDTYKGADSTNSGSNVTLSSALLLVELPITTTGGAPPQAGDTFRISLITDPLYTGFADADGETVTYTSVDGIVTISSPLAAVPEPASLSLLASAGITMVFYRLSGKRRRPGAPAA